MPVYLIRHEDRLLDDSTFRINLTDKGRHRAMSCVKFNLLKLDIDEIYSSPFLRCLQTVNPFSVKSGLGINVENTLQEVFFDPNFLLRPKSELNDLDKNIYNVNSNYRSLIPPNTLTYPESEKSIEDRVTLFWKNIVKPNLDSNKNILVCSHMGIVNMLIKRTVENRGLKTFYPMGQISKLDSKSVLYIN